MKWKWIGGAGDAHAWEGRKKRNSILKTNLKIIRGKKRNKKSRRGVHTSNKLSNVGRYLWTNRRTSRREEGVAAGTCTEGTKMDIIAARNTAWHIKKNDEKGLGNVVEQ